MNHSLNCNPYGVTVEFIDGARLVKIAFYWPLVTSGEVRKVYLIWRTVCFAIDTRFVDRTGNRMISSVKAAAGRLNLMFHRYRYQVMPGDFGLRTNLELRWGSMRPNNYHMKFFFFLYSYCFFLVPPATSVTVLWTTNQLTTGLFSAIIFYRKS